MSVICVFICTTALVFSTLLVPARAQNFDFSMKLQPPNVIMTLTTTNPQAWVGVGWNNQGRMFPADAIVCRATDTPACTDRYCTSGNECAIDPNQDIEFTSTVTNGSAQFVVTRLMNTNDPTDHVVVSGDQAMIWATAPGPTSLIHPSGSYGSITVSFDASGNSTVSEPETHFLYWVAIAVFVLLVILGGLVSFFNIAFLRHSRIGPGLKHNIVGLDTIAELSLGDILFIIIYVGAVIIGTLGYHFASHNGFTDSLGFTMAILMGMMIFPVTRLSIISWILGISYERTVKYHRWMGRVLWVATTIHFIIMQRSFPRSFIFSTQGSAGGTIWGFIAWVFLTLLIITSVEPVRRRFHSLFLVSHFLFLIPTLVFSCLHYPNTFVLVVISGGLYVFDWLHRIYCLLNKPSVEITALGSSHTKVLIRPRKNFSWGPGQYIFVQIGCEVDPHPFTITNAPQGADSNLKNNGNEIVLIVKNMGPGTATSRLNKASSTSIRIMGPYGSLSVPPEKYKTIYLCAGGIGITPMASILDFLITDKNRYKNVQHVVFIWAVREMILVEQYSDLFTRAAGSQTFKFKLGVFLTSASQPIEMPYGVISAGRPNCREILQSTPPDKNEAAAMYICGPDPFVVAAIDDGRDLPYKVHIHTETFNL